MVKYSVPLETILCLKKVFYKIVFPLDETAAQQIITWLNPKKF